MPVIQYFIDHGADVNALFIHPQYGFSDIKACWGNQTALHIAVREGKRDLVETLLRCGADKEMKTRNINTGYKWMNAIEIAQKKGYMDLVDVLRGRESTD